MSVELIIEVFLGFGVSRWGNLSRLINFNIIFIVNTYSSSSILNSSSTIIYMRLHISPSLLLLLLQVSVELIIEVFLGFGVSRWGNLSRLINFNIIFIVNTYSSSSILNSSSTIIYMRLHVSPSCFDCFFFLFFCLFCFLKYYINNREKERERERERERDREREKERERWW